MIFIPKENGDRDKAPNHVVFVTDGKSSKPWKTPSAAATLHKQRPDIDVIAVGVTDQTDNTVLNAELNAIASKETEVFYVDDYEQLQNLKTTIQKIAVCQGRNLFAHAHVCMVVFARAWAFSVLERERERERERMPRKLCVCVCVCV